MVRAGISESLPGEVRVFTSRPVREPISCPVSATKAVSNEPSLHLPYIRQKARVHRQRIAATPIQRTTSVTTFMDVEGIGKVRKRS